MTKISLFVHDLSSNPIVRAVPIGRALEAAGYDVEVLGLLIGGQEVYRPYRHAFTYRVRSSSLRPIDVFKEGRELARQATGDVFYAFKPLWTTFYPAWLASRKKRPGPLLLDVEDEEFTFRRRSLWWTVLSEPVRGWGNANSLKYTIALHPLTRAAQAVSVVSTKLQERYGGTILLHGPSDADARPSRAVFEPASDGVRVRFGLPEDVPIVAFAGYPRPHKGLDIIVRALKDAAGSSYHLALAGPPEADGFRIAQRELGDRCHLVGLLDQEDMPAFLSAIDIVPVLQKPNRITEAQVPAKLLEAMAMERIVIGSKVGDLPRLLAGENNIARGWLVDPNRPEEFAGALKSIREDPSEAKRRARLARHFFETEASVEVNAERVDALVRLAYAAARRGDRPGVALSSHCSSGGARRQNRRRES